MNADETTAARVEPPMSEERIAEIRRRAENMRERQGLVSQLTAVRLSDLTKECLSEIARQRAVVAERDAVIADREWEIERLGGWITYMLDADDATIILAGEAVPDER